MKRFFKRSWLLTALLAIAAACSSVTPNRSTPVNHDFGPNVQQSADDHPLFLDAPVWLWDERIRYRLLYKDVSAIRYYNLDRWEAPPPALLERRLKDVGMQHYRLKIRLTQFEQQFRSPDDAQVVMSLSVSAFSTKDYRLLGNRSFQLSQKSATADAAGAVASFIALTEQARTDIQTWLRGFSDE